jgi:hypothetical protein
MAHFCGWEECLCRLACPSGVWHLSGQRFDMVLQPIRAQICDCIQQSKTLTHTKRRYSATTGVSGFHCSSSVLILPTGKSSTVLLPCKTCGEERSQSFYPRGRRPGPTNAQTSLPKTDRVEFMSSNARETSKARSPGKADEAGTSAKRECVIFE